MVGVPSVLSVLLLIGDPVAVAATHVISLKALQSPAVRVFLVTLALPLRPSAAVAAAAAAVALVLQLRAV